MRRQARVHSRWIIVALGFVLILGSTFAAEAQQVNIDFDPKSPTTADAIEVQVSGMANTSCVPRSPQESVDIDAKEITIDTRSGGVVCLPVLTAWNFSVELSPLPAGRYEVVVRLCASPVGECSQASTIGNAILVVTEVPDTTPPGKVCFVTGPGLVEGVGDACDELADPRPSPVTTYAPVPFGWQATGEDDTSDLAYATRLAPDEAEFSGFRNPGENGVSYQCLDDGSYTLFVKARDAAGNESNASFTGFRVEVPADRPAPQVDTLTGPTGVITTRDVNFAWTGKGNEVTPLNCIQFAARLTPFEADFADAGTATSKSYTGLGGGDYTFEVQARDPGGKVSSRTVSFSVNVPDGSPPETSVVSGPTGIVSSRDASFAWAGSDNATPSGNLVYAFRLDPIEANFGSFGSATSTTFNDLADGAYTFLVKARDQAGIEDPSPASRSFTVNSGPATPLSVLVAANAPTFAMNQQLRLDVTVANPGPARTVDVFLGAVLPAEAGPGLGCPKRDAVVFVTAEFAGLQLTCLSAAPERFQPLRRDFSLPGTLPATRLSNFFGGGQDFFTYRWGGPEPAGPYTFFVVFTPTGALGDGRIDPMDLLVIGSRMATFAP